MFRSRESNQECDAPALRRAWCLPGSRGSCGKCRQSKMVNVWIPPSHGDLSLFSPNREMKVLCMRVSTARTLGGGTGRCLPSHKVMSAVRGGGVSSLSNRQGTEEMFAQRHVCRLGLNTVSALPKSRVACLSSHSPHCPLQNGVTGCHPHMLFVGPLIRTLGMGGSDIEKT